MANSNKGLLFWGSNAPVLFIRAFIFLSLIYDILATFLAAYSNRSMMYLILMALPFVVISFFTLIHDPRYKLEETLAAVDPEILSLLIARNPKMRDGHAGMRVFILYKELLRVCEWGYDFRIIAYVNNNRLVAKVGMLLFTVCSATVIGLAILLS